MKKDDFGVWEVTIPARDGKPAIAHNSKIKVSGLTVCAASQSVLTLILDYVDDP